MNPYELNEIHGFARRRNATISVTTLGCRMSCHSIGAAAETVHAITKTVATNCGPFALLSRSGALGFGLSDFDIFIRL